MIERKKSILIISALDIWTIGPHEGSQARWYTLKSYAEHGWSVHFITSHRERDFDEEIQKKYRNIYIRRLNLSGLQKAAAKIPKIGFFLRILFWAIFQTSAFFAALEIAKKEKIDVIYGYEIYGVPVAKLLSILWKIPVVSRFQGTSIKLFWMKKIFWKIRAWEHVTAFKIPADLVIMTNDGTQGDKVLRYFNVNSGKIRFWMNGVNWEEFNKDFNKEKIKQELNISSEYILTSISRLASWKRIDRSIKALSKIIKKIPDITFLIIGDGPERKNLERLSRDFGVNHYIHFVGAIPHREIPKYLAVADIFLSFYDWSNMGNPLIEAMMAEKCIVTLNNGDTGTIIKNNHDGILLEESENLIDNISEKVIYLLKNSGLRGKLAKNAKKFAEKNFWTWEERMNTEIKEVEKLLSNK